MTVSNSEHRYTKGRLRLDEAGAYDLADALEREWLRLITARAELRDEGISPAVTYYNRRLASIKRIKTELRSLMREKGWSYLWVDEEGA